MCKMDRIGLTVSEEMSFENVDGRTTDAVYLRLRYANNNLVENLVQITAKILNFGKNSC